jgi:hypothetical protein
LDAENKHQNQAEQNGHYDSERKNGNVQQKCSQAPENQRAEENA